MAERGREPARGPGGLDTPGQAHRWSQLAQSLPPVHSPAGVGRGQAAKWGHRAVLTTTLPPLPCRVPASPPTNAPHHFRSSASSLSLASLADSSFCRNALASLQAAWPRPMKLLRAGWHQNRASTRMPVRSPRRTLLQTGGVASPLSSSLKIPGLLFLVLPSVQ